MSSSKSKKKEAAERQKHPTRFMPDDNRSNCSASGNSCRSFEHSGRNQIIDLDDILPTIGEFGLYQKLIVWLICLPACLPCGFCAFNQLFMSDLPDHWCAVAELDRLTAKSHDSSARVLTLSRNNFTDIFRDNLLISKCYRHKLNWTQLILAIDNNEDVDIDTIRNQSETESCLDGWVYDRSRIQSSIVIDFNLVCNRSILPTVGLAALNIGGPIGVFSFGEINDKFGRKISFFLCLTIMLAGNILTAFSTDIWIWIFSRFISGLTVPALYQIPFIIALELVGPNYRSFITVMTCTFYTSGTVLLPAISYLSRHNWRFLTLVTSVPFSFYYCYWYFLPESPRWLLSKNRRKQALQILEQLAWKNGKPLPDKIRKLLTSKYSSNDSSNNSSIASKGNPPPTPVPTPPTSPPPPPPPPPSSSYGAQDNNSRTHSTKNFGIKDLFCTPNMRLKTCLITINWLATETVYVGLSYYSPMLGTNHYLNFAFSSLVELPSYMICWPIMERFGRKWPLCICMVVSGIFCLVTVKLDDDQIYLTLVLYLLSKFTISASFLIIYPFAGELYPTQLRGIGIGFSSYIAGMGLIVIPFVVYLGTSKSLRLPLTVMGMLSILCGFSSLRLPETVHSRMPQTIEECDLIGRNWTWHDYFSCAAAGSLESLCSSSTTSLRSESSDLRKVPKPRRKRHDRKKEHVELRVINESSHEKDDEQHYLDASSDDNLLSSTNEDEDADGGEESGDRVTDLRSYRNRSASATSAAASAPQPRKKFVRQSSFMDTQKNIDGTMKITYWF